MFQPGYDLYRDEINDELQRYFDRYAKGVDNGWETTTPAVRLSLLGFEGSPTPTVIEREELAYPPERQQLRTFFIDVPSKSLMKIPPTVDAKIMYEGHHLTDSVVSIIISINVRGR